jgi:hypothetical protein
MSIVRFAAGSVAMVLFALMNLAVGGSKPVDATLDELGKWS